MLPSIYWVYSKRFHGKEDIDRGYESEKCIAPAVGHATIAGLTTDNKICESPKYFLNGDEYESNHKNQII